MFKQLKLLFKNFCYAYTYQLTFKTPCVFEET